MTNWIRRHVPVVAVLTGLALGGSAAMAKPSGQADFMACDGYPAPGRTNDGMQGTSIWAVGADQNTRAARANLGAAGVSICTAALEDPRLAPEFWPRRVNLLRARAINRMAAGDLKGGLADLDAAEGAADAGDPYYQHSLKVGIDLVRAYALRRSGDLQGALRLAERAEAVRAYDRQTSLAAMVVIGGDPRFEDQLDAHLVKLARLNPEYIDHLFMREFARGRYDAALGYYPFLVAPHHGDRGTNAAEGFRLSRAMYRAFMLASMGKGDEAQKMVAEERGRLEEATREPPALGPSPGNGADSRAKRAYRRAVTERDALVATRTRLKRDLEPILTRGSAAVERRLRVTKGEGAAVLAEVQGAKDLMSQELAWAAKGAKAADRPPVYTGQLFGLDGLSPADELAALMSYLPRVENRSRMATFKGGALNWFGTDTANYQGPGKDGIATAGYFSLDATPNMVEDLAIMNAAFHALKAGHRAFIIVDRDDYRHVTISYVGQPAETGSFSGYSTELKVLYVDPDRLPAAYAGQGWRVIDAQGVMDGLSPFYAAPPVAK